MYWKVGVGFVTAAALLVVRRNYVSSIEELNSGTESFKRKVRRNRRGGKKKLENRDHICPISLQIMINPVTTEDGYNYEREFIVEWFERCLKKSQGGLPVYKSPLTGDPLKTTILTPNKQLQTEIRSKYPNLFSELKNKPNQGTIYG